MGDILEIIHSSYKLKGSHQQRHFYHHYPPPSLPTAYHSHPPPLHHPIIPQTPPPHHSLLQTPWVLKSLTNPGAPHLFDRKCSSFLLKSASSQYGLSRAKAPDGIYKCVIGPELETFPHLLVTSQSEHFQGHSIHLNS